MIETIKISDKKNITYENAWNSYHFNPCPKSSVTKFYSQMGDEIVQNFEYAGAHIKEYIDEDKLFSTFEIEDIKKNHQFCKIIS